MENPFTPLHRALLAAVLVAGATRTAQAQNGVGIGTTAPDASAALDIVATSKGALLPRVAGTGSVPNPATGLIVFQIGAPTGYYYNAGTPGIPDWQQIATASGAAVTASNGLTKVGNDSRPGGTLTGATTIGLGANNLSFISTTGTVGIGATSAARLHVRGLDNAYPATTGATQSVGLIGRFQTGDNAIFDLGGNSTGGAWLQSTDVTVLNQNYPLLLNPNGGTTAPAQALDVNGAAEANRALVLNEILLDVNGTNNGTFDGQNALKFGLSSSGEGVGSKRPAGGNQFGLELFTGLISRLAVTASGNVGIGTTAPAARLDVNGSVAVESSNVTRVRGPPRDGQGSERGQNRLRHLFRRGLARHRRGRHRQQQPPYPLLCRGRSHLYRSGDGH